MTEYIERKKIGLTDLEIAMCNGDYKKAFKMLNEKIDSIPAADVVERKKGKWIDSKCSECGGLIPITKVMLRGKVMWETDYPMSRFCPNCGADMREKKKMTNKEWMATLTAEQFYNKMMNLIYNYGFRFDNTRLAIIN